MINKFSKFVFFYLAYLPLFIGLLVLNLDLSWNLLYLSLGVIFLGALIFLPLLKSINSLAPHNIEISIISNNNVKVLGFIFTYLFPLLITFTNINSILTFSIFIILVFTIYIDTPLFSVNPLLKIIFRYNIYQVKHKNKKYFFLSKEKYSEGKIDTKVKQIDPEVLIENG